MEELSTSPRERVGLVLDGTQIVYVARSTPNASWGISLAIGSRLPAAWTSMGRAARRPRRCCVDALDHLVWQGPRSNRSPTSIRCDLRSDSAGTGSHSSTRSWRSIRSAAPAARSPRPNPGRGQRGTRGASDPEGTARRDPADLLITAQHRGAAGETMTETPHPLIGRGSWSINCVAHRGHHGAHRCVHCPHPSPTEEAESV